MVGGNKQSFIRSEEILKSYGKKIKFMGNPGSGQPDGEFPGAESIFHPARDPRSDPRRGGS